MKAIMVIDDYSDLTLGFEYAVTKVLADGHIMLEGSPRRYKASSFCLMNGKGKKISFREAYRLSGIDTVKKKLGIT